MRPKHEGPPTGNVGFRCDSFRAVRAVSVRATSRARQINSASLTRGADLGEQCKKQ